MTPEQINIILKYKDYPEGSLSKKSYDSVFMSFQDYLNKYYVNNDLKQWKYINSKFVTPLFDGTKWEDYYGFLYKVKPNFVPVENRVKQIWEVIKNDTRFDYELKHFFTFLYSINFFREFSFEEWLNINNWSHPWFENEQDKEKSILEILKYNHSENYLKEQLASLSIF